MATCKCKEYEEAHDEGRTDVKLLSAPRTDKPLNVIWEEPEDLVTADDVSSTMFTDEVITAIEAPVTAGDTTPVRKPLVLVGMDGMKGRVRRIRDWFERKHRLGFSQTRMEEDDERVEILET
ncbi:hypothetical protein TELCIR_05323 [Teladorsagia circumcincta]|uniref:Uncharacterized protein n=1 Tax=Teladorsagia circumcincta TaxID=45464 RepID=A0A2G9UR67_TELCI|nr:hypothetical protein TELCIR_05323 [Teladorsagia circumcincta]